MEFVYWLRDLVELCSWFTREMLSKWVLLWFAPVRFFFYFMEKQNWMCMLSSQSINNWNAFFPPFFLPHFVVLFCVLPFDQFYIASNFFWLYKKICNNSHYPKSVTVVERIAQIMGTLAISRRKKNFANLV